MTCPPDAIRAIRAASNAAIAARDADLVVACMLFDATVSVARGPILHGREASRVAFAEQFADRAFLGYVREPTDIVVDAGTRATERGRWTGRWRHGATEQVMRGTYVAEWRHTELGWFIQSEISHLRINTAQPRNVAIANRINNRATLHSPLHRARQRPVNRIRERLLFFRSVLRMTAGIRATHPQPIHEIPDR